MNNLKYLTFFLILNSVSAFSQRGVYNIQEFGAIDNGKTLNTKSIQNTIDECAKNGGGKIIVPPGEYLTGPLFLKSNITIELYPGAVIIFDDNIENCPIIDGRWEGIERKVYASLFTGHNLENIAIIGRGTIEGQGEKWWKASYENKAIRKNHGIREREPENPPESPLKVPRPRLINLYNCTNVLISELTFRNSPSWTIHPVYCNNVTIEKVSIIQPYESPNTDGINPESCKNVRISNCFIDVGDDCITIKSGYNEDGRRVGIPCEDITISNCTFAHGRSAIGIGSEMSGGVRNVTVTNCSFNGTLRGIRIKTGRGRGGIVENIRVSNIVMSNIKEAISIDMYYGRKDTGTYVVSEETPFLKNIHLSNITATNITDAVIMRGLPEAPIDGFSILNSTFNAINGMYIEYVNGLQLRDIELISNTGNALSILNGTDVTIDNLNGENFDKGNAFINLENSSDILIHSCKFNKESDIFLKKTNTKGVVLENNWLGTARIITE